MGRARITRMARVLLLEALTHPAARDRRPLEIRIENLRQEDSALREMARLVRRLQRPDRRRERPPS